MFEGNDRAMRERTMLDEELKQSKEIDSIKLTAGQDTKGIDENSEKEDEQYGFINNSDTVFTIHFFTKKKN